MTNTNWLNNQVTFPINSVNKLASLLRINSKELKNITKMAENLYSPFDIKQIKENGDIKKRHIDNPLPKLKSVQKKINQLLIKNAINQLPPSITGGRVNQSIFTNASKHTNQEAVATIDIKDCFPMTKEHRIFRVWRNHLKNGVQVSKMLMKLTVFQKCLPQGAPTSSSLCNLALLPLHLRILDYCNRNDLNLTQFVDDITISGKVNKVRLAIKKIILIIQIDGYSVRTKKVKIMLAKDRQKTTGLVVNRKVSIPKKFINSVRKEIIESSSRNKTKTKSIFGKINHISIVSHKKGDKLRNLINLHY